MVTVIKTPLGEDRRERWERAMDWPLSIAALIFLAAFAIPILNPDMSDAGKELARVVEWTTWGLFALDYIVRLSLTRDRWPWVRRHVLDLLVVILPVLRPFRLLRLLTVLTTVQRRDGSAVPWRISRRARGPSHPRTNDGWRGSFEPLGTLWLTRLIGPIRVTSAVRTDLNWRGYPWLGSSSAIGERTARVMRVAFTIGLEPGSAMTCSWISMRSGQASISPG